MTNTQKEVKANRKAVTAPQRKRMVETIKTMLIVALVVGVGAFVAGVHYEQHVGSDKQSAVTSALKASSLKN